MQEFYTLFSVAFVVKTDFPLKSEEMCDFFDKRGYPASVVKAGHHRAQQIDQHCKRLRRRIIIEFHSPSQPRSKKKKKKKL